MSLTNDIERLRWLDEGGDRPRSCADCGSEKHPDAMIQCPRCKQYVCLACYCQAQSLCGRCDEDMHGLSIEDWNSGDEEAH